MALAALESALMAPLDINSQPSSQPTAADLYPSLDEVLLSTLSASAHTFLRPTLDLHTASLVQAKRYLDPLASSISQLQAQRQRKARKKRKRCEEEEYRSKRLLQIREIYTTGFDLQQVWGQAKRVLDASLDELEGDFSKATQRQEEDKSTQLGANSLKERSGVKRVGFDEDSFESGRLGPEGTERIDDTSFAEGNLEARTEDHEIYPEPSQDNENKSHLGDRIDENAGHDIEREDSVDDSSPSTFVADKNGLNDGFFSIEDFNKQSEFLEQQDARGDPNDGAASDEEEIDWDADPMTMTAEEPPNGRPIYEDYGNVDEVEDDGPTFGNADLNATSTDEEDFAASDMDVDAGNGLNNTNDIKYADFFAPPPRKAAKTKRMRALPKTQFDSSNLLPKDDLEIERTMSAVRRDLFEDDLSANEDSDPVFNDDLGNPKTRRSNHEKRQAELAEEIRRLEAASVAKREWTLSGEARAADRPINSLLEEDLEFERTGKPVPVITNEVSEDIEALIKRRILAREFDEVIKRRPGSLVQRADASRRGRFELDDSKPQQGLAEMYEAQHLRAADPAGYSDTRDEKLIREHAEIEKLWKDVSGKLDALSSLHYKPKPPSATINVVADVPTILMEDARPSAGGEVGGASMLAPQEVYRPGEEKVKGTGEVVLRSGLPMQREEMSKEEKVRRRRREKERIKKAGGVTDEKGIGAEAKRSKADSEVVGQLRKGGVRVIGKKGEIKDVEGKHVKPRTAVKGGGAFKL